MRKLLPAIIALVFTFTFITPSYAMPSVAGAQTGNQDLKITDIAVSKLERDAVTIIWKTNMQADSLVEYSFVNSRQGRKANNLNRSKSDSMVWDHQVSLDPKTLVSGSLYYFKVTSKDKFGNIAISDQKTFVLPGFKGKIIVKDSSNKAVSGAEVKLPAVGVSGKTDKNGELELSDLPDGDIKIIVQFKEEVKEGSLKVSNDQVNELTLVLGQKIGPDLKTTLASIIVLILIVGGSIFSWGLLKNKISTPTAPTVEKQAPKIK